MSNAVAMLLVFVIPAASIGAGWLIFRDWR